jgi:hypothetical protein
MKTNDRRELRETNCDALGNDSVLCDATKLRII